MKVLRTTRAAWAVASCLAMLVLVGCQSRSGLEGLPKLGEIRTERSRTQSEPELLERGGSGARPALVTVQRLILPLNYPTDELWTRVDEQVLSTSARQAWNDNGLRLGQVGPEQMQAFLAQLDHAVAGPQRQSVLSTQPAPLHTAPRLNAQITVDLSELGGQAEALGSEGAWRLLGHAQVQGSAVGLMLKPHHYQRRSTLTPRDPLEIQLDGRVFEEMAVQLSAGSDRLLVVGLYRPWPEVEQDEDGPSHLSDDDYQVVELEPFRDAQTEQDQTQALHFDQEHFDEQREMEEMAPELDWHMGRALMTASRAGRPVQTVLLIWAQPVPGSASRQANPGVQAPSD